MVLELPICLDDPLLLRRRHLACAVSVDGTAACMDHIKTDWTRSNSGALAVADPLLHQEFLGFHRCQETRKAPSCDSVLPSMIPVNPPDLFEWPRSVR